MQQGAFPGARSTLHSQHLSGQDREFDPLQDFDDFTAASEDKGFSQPVDLEERMVPGLGKRNQTIPSLAGLS